MKNKKRRPEKNIIEVFEYFSNLPIDEQIKALKQFDEAIQAQPPDYAEFFATLRGYLAELHEISKL
jgi:phage-related protein